MHDIGHMIFIVCCSCHHRLHAVEVRARERMGTLYGMDFDVLQEGSGGVAAAWRVVCCDSRVLTLQTNVADITETSLFNHCMCMCETSEHM